ncbi:Gfo/Idh/MocA family protein [Liquorilactobacillus cacaonum]|uniref:Oxidoreductase n=1 Tax=Liquorilactobacillus cacaonum DSM 21116 TaxID=1423729 RepID=A0A0R2CKV7_9LACO|nr:Gfo/Idh/MocA family oxidoreductase [Liquorilactobacillus cacaonum]KRM91930.1 oxidoreductase [Liquorilactobacillus cacaonum DSM 21116]
MKIGVIGLGNIAQKAYLPIYTKIGNQAEFIFATRNDEVRKKLQTQYNLKKIVKTVDELIDEKIEACFIHTTTESHFELAKKCLSNGINVFMDKPASENLAQVKELQQLALKNSKILMIGFNRRFAPMVEKLKKIKKKRIILLQKNRAAATGDIKYMIFDLFIHIVDVAIYLLDDKIVKTESNLIENNGNIEMITVSITTKKTLVNLVMDLNSGANRELYEVTSPEGTYTLENLSRLKIFRDNKSESYYFEDWDNPLYVRGFEQMVTHFIDSVKMSTSSDLRQKNIYLSHKICEEIINNIKIS